MCLHGFVHMSPLWLAALLRWVSLEESGSEDTLAILGSGRGRFALEAFLRTEVGSIVGVEIASRRHMHADQQRIFG